MFKTVKYYDSADIMPIGRYMLATCRDVRYFAIGDLPEKVNPRKLKKAIDKLNSTILKNRDAKAVLSDLQKLSIDEGKIYLQSALVALIDYSNELIRVGVDSKEIEKRLKPVQHLLIERGLSPDSKKNASRLEKVTRNFIVKSNDIKNRLKNKDADLNKVYESYLRNLVLIYKTFGVKIDEHKDSINKYVLLIDEINKHGN